MKLLKNILLLGVSLFLCLLALEGVARFMVDFDANYYAAPRVAEKGSVRRHPYGDIPVNSLGYFDGEFERNGKPSIGYFGDSVAYGVGAGYPFRITEVLETLQPDTNHLNLSDGIGTDASKFSYSRLRQLKDDFNITKVIYLMNLNDILPVYKKQSVALPPGEQSGDSRSNRSDFMTFLVRLKDRFDNLLLGKSMLYAWTRSVIKSRFMTWGYDVDGYKAIELLPEQNADIITAAADGLNGLGTRLIDMGIKACIAILPYEMQVSRNAAEVYRKLGINFSDGFRNFETQKILASGIKEEIPVIILGKSFPEKPVGTFFVYNKGDRIDYNHPNRAGHKQLAEEMHRAGFCR